MAGDFKVAEDAYSWPTPDPNDVNISIYTIRKRIYVYIDVPFIFRNIPIVSF